MPPSGGMGCASSARWAREIPQAAVTLRADRAAVRVRISRQSAVVTDRRAGRGLHQPGGGVHPVHAYRRHQRLDVAANDRPARRLLYRAGRSGRRLRIQLRALHGASPHGHARLHPDQARRQPVHGEHAPHPGAAIGSSDPGAGGPGRRPVRVGRADDRRGSAGIRRHAGLRIGAGLLSAAGAEHIFVLVRTRRKPAGHLLVVSRRWPISRRCVPRLAAHHAQHGRAHRHRRHHSCPGDCRPTRSD